MLSSNSTRRHGLLEACAHHQLLKPHLVPFVLHSRTAFRARFEGCAVFGTPTPAASRPRDPHGGTEPVGELGPDPSTSLQRFDAVRRAARA